MQKKNRQFPFKSTLPKGKTFYKGIRSKIQRKVMSFVFCILQCIIDRNGRFGNPISMCLLDAVLLIPILA